MACCLQGNDPDAQRSKEIEENLRKDRRALNTQVKVLLLGSGESGKSTFVKQMKIIHGRGEWNREELNLFRQQIYSNLLEGMWALLENKRRNLRDVPYQRSESERKAKEFVDFFVLVHELVRKEKLELHQVQKVAPLITALWEDSAIKESFERRSLGQVHDSCKYFFENIARIARPEYVATNKDILYCRKATRNIQDHIYTIQSQRFRFIDVGGQRSQRQKWFQCFEGIHGVLFLAASSEYDQKSQEDRQRNRMGESLDVFDTIINNIVFRRTAVILFLNKTDLLEEKVPRSDISKYFSDFTGNPFSLEDVKSFLLAKYKSYIRPGSQRTLPLYHYHTTAIDTENIRRVFESVKDACLLRNINDLMMS